MQTPLLDDEINPNWVPQPWVLRRAEARLRRVASRPTSRVPLMHRWMAGRSWTKWLVRPNPEPPQWWPPMRAAWPWMFATVGSAAPLTWVGCAVVGLLLLCFGWAFWSLGGYGIAWAFWAAPALFLGTGAVWGLLGGAVARCRRTESRLAFANKDAVAFVVRCRDTPRLSGETRAVLERWAGCGPRRVGEWADLQRAWNAFWAYHKPWSDEVGLAAQSAQSFKDAARDAGLVAVSEASLLDGALPSAPPGRPRARM